MANYRLPEGAALMLRTCDENMMAYGGFRWPESGEVVAPDWSPKPICGYGLHGLLWGQGYSGHLCWSPSAKWLVCQVRLADVVDLGRKVKVPRAKVVFCGERQGALDFLRPYLKPGMALHGEVFTGGADCVFTGGNRSTLTGGDYSTLTGGEGSRLTGGYGSTLTGGEGSILCFRHRDAKRVVRERLIVAYVGEDGIEPGVAYRCDGKGQIVKA